MASFDNQRGWAPLENIGDCSQGLCTMYCPQWCYVLFPPPPPFPFTGESDNSSGTAFSPLVIAIIGILATALLLISYYTVVNKYCGSFSFHRHRHHRHQNLDGNLAEEEEVRGGSGDQANRQESWNLPSSNGLDEALISKITVYRYKRGEGLLNCTNCSVCLAEFREGDSLRLLPKCCHAFHLQCIDTWFKSHSNCPLCRANILQSLVFEEDTATRAVPPAAEYQQETVVVVEDLNLETGGKQENEEENGGNSSKDFEVIEIEDQDRRHFRRSLSMGSTSRGRVSIAEVLQISMENEYMLAKDHWIVAGGGSRAVSSRQAEREHRRARSSISSISSISRGLHCVMSPVPMKRSVSSARSCFARQGRGRTSLLPV